MAQKQYKNYLPMKCKLQRICKVHPCLKQYGALTTLLFDTFLKNNGYLSSKDYYGSKFEVQGKNYTEWIHELKEARVIVQYKSDGNKKSDFIRFAAGPLISEYINAEKLKANEIATKSELFVAENQIANLGTITNHHQQEIEALKARVSNLETDSVKTKESMNDLYKQLNLGEIDPPDYKKSRRILALVKTQTN